MNDGNHGMGGSGGMHMGVGGGHSQMTSGSVMTHMTSEGQNHSQRPVCVRHGCSNVASSPME